MAQDRDMQQIQAPAKAPISAHPAFPLIVGLWFAALLGLGTIVLPAVVLEKAAGVTGFSSVFPQTAAPLTAGARAAFALLAAMLGLIGGLLLARRIAETQIAARVPRRRTPHATESHATPPRPLSVHDDLGEAAIEPAIGAQRKPIMGRRRTLAVIEDERSGDILLAAPLPGSETVVPPQLFADDEDSMSERSSGIDIPAPHHETADGFAPSNPVAEADASEPAGGTLEPLTLEPIDAPLEDLGIVQLAERLGRSMQRRLNEAKSRREPEPEAEPLAFCAPSIRPEEGEDETLAVPPPVVPEALRAFMDGPPAEFAPQPVVPAALQTLAFDASESDEEDDDETLDPGSFALPLTAVEPRPFDARRAPEAENTGDEAEDDEAIADDNCSSLLSIKNPLRLAGEFVRVGKPEVDGGGAIEPAAVSPNPELATNETGQESESQPPENVALARPFDSPHEPPPGTAPARPRAAPDPVETERALRSALANLQRMSGAA